MDYFEEDKKDYNKYKKKINYIKRNNGERYNYKKS